MKKSDVCYVCWIQLTKIFVVLYKLVERRMAQLCKDCQVLQRKTHTNVCSCGMDKGYERGKLIYGIKVPFICRLTDINVIFLLTFSLKKFHSVKQRIAEETYLLSLGHI